MAASQWTPGPIVAWTESDGPGRPRRAPAARTGAAAVLAAGVAGWGMMTADEVCPEHALLIEIAAAAAVVLIFASVVAWLRSSVMAAPLVLAASVLALTVGVVDTMHDVTSQRIIAVAAAIAAVLAAYSAVVAAGHALWGRRHVDPATRPINLPAVADSGDATAVVPAEVAPAAPGADAPVGATDHH